MNKRKIGLAGEQFAVEYLLENGFMILDRNFRSGRIGEIDIIAAENEYICFIEVKTRTGNLFGIPAEAVGYKKRQRLKALAWIYLKQKNYGERNMRFDIVEVTAKSLNGGISPEHIHLIRSAF